MSQHFTEPTTAPGLDDPEDPPRGPALPIHDLARLALKSPRDLTLSQVQELGVALLRAISDKDVQDGRDDAMN